MIKLLLPLCLLVAEGATLSQLQSPTPALAPTLMYQRTADLCPDATMHWVQWHDHFCAILASNTNVRYAHLILCLFIQFQFPHCLLVCAPAHTFHPTHPLQLGGGLSKGCFHTAACMLCYRPAPAFTPAQPFDSHCPHHSHPILRSRSVFWYHHTLAGMTSS